MDDAFRIRRYDEGSNYSSNLYVIEYKDEELEEGWHIIDFFPTLDQAAKRMVDLAAAYKPGEEE